MLANVSYCPVLHTRVAEIKALSQLPASSKDLILPLIVARPWPNANHLAHTWKKVAEAFGPRRFALDLDGFKRGATTDKLAGSEFDALFDVVGAHSNYYELVSSLEHAIPTLQLSAGGVPDLAGQIAYVDAIDQGLVLRLKFGQVAHPIELVRSVLALYPDTMVVIDLGWSPDLLSRELWASGVIAAISDIRPETELVVAGSSFPDTFDRIRDRGEFRANERVVFDNLVRRHNAVALTYGDWGSTREPRDGTVMRTVPRIDLPLSREWISFRRDGAEDYPDIARRVVKDPLWPKDLNIWGTYAIRSTAESLPGAITGTAAAAAARVNIHLHRQATFGIPGAIQDGDEPYTDD